MQEHISWNRFSEPIQHTLARNLAIAAFVGAAVALRRHDLGLLLPFSALALWFSLGGHYVELAFLNGIRPRLPVAGITQRVVRLAVWFAGGTGLYLFMALTARLLSIALPPLGSWWIGGLLLLSVELIVHAALGVRGTANFYNGQG